MGTVLASTILPGARIATEAAAMKSVKDVPNQGVEQKKGETMSDYNMTPVCENKETVKDILESTSALLLEAASLVEQISNAVYRGGGPVNGEPKLTQEKPTMLGEILSQRDTADRLLREIRCIKDALW